MNRKGKEKKKKEREKKEKKRNKRKKEKIIQTTVFILLLRDRQSYHLYRQTVLCKTCREFFVFSSFFTLFFIILFSYHNVYFLSLWKVFLLTLNKLTLNVFLLIEGKGLFFKCFHVCQALESMVIRNNCANLQKWIRLPR